MLVSCSRGQSTLELLVTTALVMFLALAMMQLFTNNVQAGSQRQAQETRARLIDRLTHIAGMPASIRASAYAATNNDQGADPFNSYFAICVNALDYSKPCVNNNGNGLYQPFRLYMPMTDNPAPNVFRTSGAITGTPAYPMRYNANAICDTSASTCSPADYPWEAFTEFLPFCSSLAEFIWRGWAPGPMPEPALTAVLTPMDTCSFSRYMQVKLTVRPTPGGTGTLASAFKAYSEIVTIDTALARYARQ